MVIRPTVAAVAADEPEIAAKMDDLHVRIGLGERLHRRVLDRRAVDLQHATDHLDSIARQSDHPFDVIGGWVARQPEYH